MRNTTIELTISFYLLVFNSWNDCFYFSRVCFHSLSVEPVSMEKYHRFTVAHLRDLCWEREITFRSKDLKSELISKLISFHMATGTEPEPVLQDEITETEPVVSDELIEESVEESGGAGLTFEQQMTLLKMKQEHEVRMVEMRRLEMAEERKFQFDVLKGKKDHEQSRVTLIKMRDMTAEEDIEEYFQIFEKTAQGLGIPVHDWVANLAPRLNEKSRSVYLEITGSDSLDYYKVKQCVLEAYQLTDEHYRYKFRSSQKVAGEDFVLWAKRTRRYLDSWMKAAKATDNPEKILEQILLEKLNDSVSQELRVWLKEHAPSTAIEWARLANQHIQAKKGPLVGGKYVGTNWFYSQKIPPSNVSGKAAQSSPENSQEKSPRKEEVGKEKLKVNLAEVKCYNCRVFGHYASKCPKPDRRQSSDKLQPHALLCFTPLDLDRKEFPATFVQGTICGKEVDMMVDSGCSRTLVNRKFVPKQNDIGQFITVLTASGESVSVPLAKVDIGSTNGTYRETVGVLDELPVDCLLGRSSYSKTLTRKDLLEAWEKMSEMTELVEEDRAFVMTRKQALLKTAQERADLLIEIIQLQSKV